MEFDWKLIWDVFQSAIAVLAAVLVFMLGRVFLKKEAFDLWNKEEFKPVTVRLQTVEQTYVSKPQFDDLERRLGKIEGAFAGLPELVKKLNDESIELRATAKHMDKTIQRFEQRFQLIFDAAMSGDKS